MLLHLFMAAGYCIFVSFAGSSIRTVLGLLFYLHAPLALSGFIYHCHVFANSPEDTFFLFFVFGAIGIGTDALIGLISSISHKILLLFEVIGLFPTLILCALSEKGKITRLWIIFVPFLAFYVIYILLILGLTCWLTRPLSVAFFSDRGIRAEFVASSDFENYWNSALWRDDTEGGTQRRDSSDSSSGDEVMEQANIALIGSRKTDMRFPRKEKFQLYKIDGNPRRPFYISSFPMMVCIAVVLVVAVVHLVVGVKGFFYYVVVGSFLVILALVVNGRASSKSFMILTNMSDDWLQIMWDHPSLCLM
jgi:hypothetical protein